MSSRFVWIAPVACLALAACTTAHKRIGHDDPLFGEAVKYNAAVQTINLDPVYPEGGAQPGENGDRGAQAVERYRTDKVNARHKTESAASSEGGLNTTRAVGGGPQ